MILIISFRSADNFRQSKLILLGKPTLVSTQWRLLVFSGELLFVSAVVQSFGNEFAVGGGTFIRLDGIIVVDGLDFVQGGVFLNRYFILGPYATGIDL